MSKLKVYSVGVVAKDWEKGSPLIEAWPLEVLFRMEGELDGEAHVHKSNGIEMDGSAYTVNVESSESITCEWFNLESNRVTSPNVRKGEKVLIWRYGDADVFYWTSMGRDNHLRKGERVVWQWSDEPEGSETDATLVNSYTLEIDTFTGHITVETVKANKELYQYQFTINPGESYCRLADDVGNAFTLNSKETLIHLINESGSFFELNKENIRAYAPDSIYVEAVNTIDFKCKDYILNASSSITINTETYALTSTDYSMTCASAVTNASASFDLTSPAISLTGNIALTGPVAIAGPLSCAPGAGGGGASISGGASVTGAMEVSGGLTVDDITFSGSISGPGGAWHNP